MKRLSLSIACILLFLCSTVNAQQVETYRNPIIPGDFPDPTLIRVGDTYYAASSSSEWANPYRLYESKDLINWDYVGSLFNEVPEWLMGSFWAPELYYHNGTYYVYYTARRKSDQRSYIGVASTKDPQKGFTDHGLIIEWTKEAIDAYVIDIGNESYITWKAYGLDGNRPIEILGAKLSADKLKVTGEAFTLLIADVNNWEAGGIEGQCLVKHGNYIYMFYAGNSCCGRECNYQTGVARAKSVQGPWERYSGNPLMYSDNNWRCPGHGTLVETPDHRFFYSYHAYNAQTNVYTGRQGMLGEVVWNPKTGWPEFRYGKTPALQAEVPIAGTVQRPLANFTDDFTATSLRKEWLWDVKNKPQTSLRQGLLELKADASLPISFLGVQPKKDNYTLKATVVPNDSVMTGICLYGNTNQSIGISVSGKLIELWQVKDNNRIVISYAVLPEKRKEMELFLTVRFGQYIQFGWVNNHKNEPVGEPIHTGSLPQWDRTPLIGIQAQGNGNGLFKNVLLQWE